MFRQCGISFNCFSFYYSLYCHFLQYFSYFSYIVAVSYISGGHQEITEKTTNDYWQFITIYLYRVHYRYTTVPFLLLNLEHIWSPPLRQNWSELLKHIDRECNMAWKFRKPSQFNSIHHDHYCYSNQPNTYIQMYLAF